MTDEEYRRWCYDRAHEEMEKGRIKKGMKADMSNNCYSAAAETLDRYARLFSSDDLRDMRDALGKHGNSGKKEVEDVINMELDLRNRD